MGHPSLNKGSKSPTAGEQVEDEGDDGEDDEDVDPAGERVAGDEADDPKKEKDYGDSPEHVGVSPDRLAIDFSLERRTGRAARLLFVGGVILGDGCIVKWLRQLCSCGGVLLKAL